MPWVALVCCLLPCPAGAAERAADLEFARVQAEWVAAGQRTLDLPPVVEMLGSPKYVARRAAIFFLDLAPRRYLLTLEQAARSRDPEVADKARGVINRMFVCPDCKGDGHCPRCTEEHSSPECKCEYPRQHCPTCLGGGDLRFKILYSTWVGDDADGKNVYAHTLAPRDLYPCKK